MFRNNLIEILKVRPDAWLSGSFFWHESLNNFPENLTPELLSLAFAKMSRMDKYKNVTESPCVRSNSCIYRKLYRIFVTIL